MYVKFLARKKTGATRAKLPCRPRVGLDIRHSETRIFPQVDKQAQQARQPRHNHSPARAPHCDWGGP